MKIIGNIAVLPLALLGFHSVAGQATFSDGMQEISRRKFITVEYDYKLEANTSDTDLAQQYNITQPHPLEDALTQIDSTIISSIQSALPDGDIPEGKTQPDIQFDTVNTRFINMCFTESDACKWVKSRIKLSYLGDTPKNAMERLTIGLVQDFLREFSDSNPILNAMYVYPMIHSSVVQLQISPVEGAMNDTEIAYFEQNFRDVFHAMVSALDGDTDVSEAYFVKQEIEEISGKEEDITTVPSSKLSVDLKYYGKCRYCTEDELVETVDGSIEQNLDAFLKILKNNGNSYFLQTENITVSKQVPPSELPPMDTEKVSATSEPSRKLPWGLWLGVGLTAAAIFVGIVLILRDQRQLKKEEASTGDESSVYEENNHEEDDVVGVYRSDTNDIENQNENDNDDDDNDENEMKNKNDADAAAAADDDDDDDDASDNDDVGSENESENSIYDDNVSGKDNEIGKEHEDVIVRHISNDSNDSIDEINFDVGRDDLAFGGALCGADLNDLDERKSMIAKKDSQDSNNGSTYEVYMY